MNKSKDADTAPVHGIVLRLCRAFGVTIRVEENAGIDDQSLRELVSDIVDASNHRRSLEVGDTAIGRIKSKCLGARLDLKIEMTPEVEKSLECGIVCQIHSHGYVTGEDGKKYNGNLVLVPGDGVEWRDVVLPAERRR